MFGDMTMPAISKQVWESEEAKPYVEMIFAFLQLGKRVKSGSNRQGPPNLIEAHRETIKEMVKEGISTTKIGEKIGFHRNYVYKFVQENFPHLKRDNRISDGWNILDKAKAEIIKEVEKGTPKYKIMDKYGVSFRVLHEWFDREEMGQFKPNKIHFGREEVKEMIDLGASMDSMRKSFHVSPDTMRDFLKEHFPEYYLSRSKSRNKAALLEKSKDEIIQALESGATKKKICQEYDVNFVTLCRFLKKAGIA
jgi:transposase